MSTARNEILRRVRTSLRDVPAGERPEDVPVARDYQHTAEASREQIIEWFVDRLVDYKAVVRRVSAAELPRQIAESCATRGARRLVVPADLPEEWIPQDVEPLVDHNLSHAQLDESDGVLTGCALGVAQTGTIILDGGARQGRRAISLLPDYHLCVVFVDQVVGLVPEAIQRLGATVRETGRPITFISGPSATSDIELNRVEGVHGPRTLEVILCE